MSWLVAAVALLVLGFASLAGGSLPAPEDAPAPAFRSLSAGAGKTCAVLSDASVVCWGAGTGWITPHRMSGLSGVVQVSAGWSPCARSADGSVWCWGEGRDGSLGDGRGRSSKRPVRVRGIRGARDVAVGFGRACATLTNGTVWCWGMYPLGDGSARLSRSPVRVRGISSAMAAVSGFFTSCALLRDGTVRCWGSNGHGSLGTGTREDSLVPRAVARLRGVRAISGMGGEVFCALRRDASVWCWGGQFGSGRSTVSRVPTHIRGFDGATAIAAGGETACAVLPPGRVACAGSIIYPGPNLFLEAFVARIPGIDDAQNVSIGELHVCVLVADGGARCWGDGDRGQLGDGHRYAQESGGPKAPVSVRVPRAR